LVTGTKWNYQEGVIQMSEKNSTNQTIEAFQLHYTSCRYGLSGHAGFQTRAMSHDIELAEQRTVEHLGVYQRPRHLPSKPDKEQIDSLFPKVYRSTYLETGKLAVVKSVYVGQDYTKRGGNYFSHALIIKDLPDNVWPVDLYEWDGWKERLLPTEDREDASFELPIVTLTANKEAFAFGELQEFINEDSERKNQLASMIQAIFMRKETSRNIVIKEELETTGLFWIACLQKSFPPSHQKELDCSSFQFDPRTCLAINVTWGETDFVLGKNEREYQFYVFDFMAGKHSSIDSLNEYAITVSTWMSEQPERLQQFYEFTKLFKQDTVNNELLSMLHLFQFTLDDTTVVKEQDLGDLLAFANSYTKPEHFARILQVMGSIAGKLLDDGNASTIKHLAVFLEELIASIQALGAIKVHEDKNLLRRFVKFAVLANIPQLNQLEWLLKPFVEDSLAVANICVDICNILVDEIECGNLVPDRGEKSKRTFATFLGKMFEDKGVAYRFDIINVMKQNRNTWQILEVEWEHAIAKSRDKVADHANYYQQVLQESSKFSQHYQPVLSAKLWKLLSKEEQLIQAISWIQETQTKSFQGELVKTIFQTASESVSFEPKDQQSDELYKMLVEQVKHRKIVLCPNRLILREVILKASVNDFEFDKQPLEKIQPVLMGVDEKTYAEFSQLYLPLILSRITEKKQHGLVIKAVFCSKHVAIFKQSYSLFYRKRASGKFDKADLAALMFWLCLKSDDDDYQRLQPFQESVIELLSSCIARYKKQLYSALGHHFEDKKMAQDTRTRQDKTSSKIEEEEKENTILSHWLPKWRK
jgi:hypothetical protein